MLVWFFYKDTANTQIYTYLHTLSLHDALPICRLDAHLDPHIALIVHVPGAGVADHVAIARLDQLRALVKHLRQCRHPERAVKILRALRERKSTLLNSSH